MTSVRLSGNSQQLRVIAEAREDVLVEGTARVEMDGERTTIDDVGGSLVVRVPNESDLVIGATSGQVVVKGALGAVAVTTVSGRIVIEQAASVDARTDSAQVTIGQASGACRVRSESGQIKIGSCAGVDAATASGRIVLREVGGAVRAHCVSGRIDVEMAIAADADAETVSGHITIALPDGVRPYHLDEIGQEAVRPDGYDCTVRAVSQSGRIDVSNR